MQNQSSTSSSWKLFVRGLSSCLGTLLFPIGYWWCRSIKRLSQPERMEQGLIVILSGIQGKSPVEFAIARGLVDGGVQRGIVIHEWTTGLWPLFLFHLRSRWWHRRAVQKLKQYLLKYRENYPKAPITLIGHSGGTGIAAETVKSFPADIEISQLIFLNSALSPGYPLSQFENRVIDGLWNFHSPLDILFLGIGTILCGTVDGKHSTSAGMLGFSSSVVKQLSSLSIQQVSFHPRMMQAGNLGGHFGFTNRLFISKYVAPVIS